MSKKHSWRFAFLVCALSVGLLLGTTVAKAANPVPDEATNFVFIGSVDTASGGSPANSKAYSKIAPWPHTQDSFFNTGCYESGLNVTPPLNGVTNAGNIGCFRVVDVDDPQNPVRIATVETYDRVNSPRPPSPNDLYWATHAATNVWTNPAFDRLPFSTACGDWKVGGVGWTTGPTCWDKGWVTRTHYTAGNSGDFQPSGKGAYKGESIYWVNSQRQGNAPAKRLGYTGIAFYDLKNQANPQFLGRIDLDPGQRADNTYFDSSGVHHGFFDGRYAYFGGGEAGYIGHHLVIVDGVDPTNPKIVGRWWIPGQKTPEEDAIRNSTAIDPVTGLQKGWVPGNGFAPVTTTGNGLLTKDVSFHYIDVRRIKGKDIAFISWHEAGLVILDVTDKTAPKFLSRFDYLTPAFQAADTLPGAQADYNRCKFETQNLPQPTACGNAHSGKLVPGTNIFWLTDEYFTLPYGHLRFFDVSDLTKPKLISHFLVPQTTDNTVTYAERTASTHLGNTYGKETLFLAWYGLGVKAINFANPASPVLVGTYSYTIDNGDGGQATYDVIADQMGNLVVTDSVDGVRILRYTGPGAPLPK
jgi:hypothetical protein